MKRNNANILVLVAAAALAPMPAAGEVRVQDVARLKGQRTNQLTGFGLVTGLNGTGDGGKSPATMRALMALHRRYEQPVLDVDDLKVATNVALVMVAVTIPEFGAREGDSLDVVVTAEGAKSLAGGQLLTTPLQYAMFDRDDPESMRIFALAGGRIDLPDPKNPTRGIIRRGATLEEDFHYNFIDNQHITLVLTASHAGFPLAHVVVRAINHELENKIDAGNRDGVSIVATELAYAVGPKNIRVRIPPQEMRHSTGFIARVLQTPLFVMPEQIARVTINPVTKKIAFTGAVTISPTVLVIPGLGTVAVGNGAGGGGSSGLVGLDTDQVAGVRFQDLLNTLAKLKLTPQQMVEVVEHLHQTGTLHAQLVYTE